MLMPLSDDGYSTCSKMIQNKHSNDSVMTEILGWCYLQNYFCASGVDEVINGDTVFQRHF